MIRKSVVCVFFFLFVFVVGSPVFSATSTTSGSGSKPEMKFDSWRVGRSPICPVFDVMWRDRCVGVLWKPRACG